MTTFLDRVFLWARERAILYRFTLFTRILLAAGFIPTGMVKLLGKRFTSISPDTPIGAFFESMYQTGLYWRFLGATQIVAGVLLLYPRLAHLGAAVFVGVIANIFVITVALEFRGTALITGPMLLATLYLCVWDYHRFRSLFTTRPALPRVAEHALDPWERAGFALFALSLLAFFFGTRGLDALVPPAVIMATGFAAGLFTAGRFVYLAFKGRLPKIVAV